MTTTQTNPSAEGVGAEDRPDDLRPIPGHDGYLIDRFCGVFSVKRRMFYGNTPRRLQVQYTTAGAPFVLLGSPPNRRKYALRTLYREAFGRDLPRGKACDATGGPCGEGR